MYRTDQDRFRFMQDCLNRTTGTALNVGCHDDGAALRRLGRGRVINCDVAVQPGYDYPVDVLFDVRHRWPFPHDRNPETGEPYAEIVFLCDILEHLTEAEITIALSEARQVSHALCITIPHDTTLAEPIDPDAAYKVHCTTVSETLLRNLLTETGWIVGDWHTVRYVGGPVESDGYFVLAY